MVLILEGGGGGGDNDTFFHPRVGYLERTVINKAFKLVDYFKVRAVESRNLSETSEKRLRGLNLLTELSRDDNCVTRERLKTRLVFKYKFMVQAGVL